MIRNIRLGRGLGPLRFGVDIGEAEEIFGPASERVEYDDGDVHLRYWDQGVYLFFPALNRNLLEGIEVERGSGATLFGKSPFDLDRPSLIRMLTLHDGTLTPFDFSVRRTEDGEIEMQVRRLLISFFFDNSDTVSTVNWTAVEQDPTS